MLARSPDLQNRRHILLSRLPSRSFVFVGKQQCGHKKIPTPGEMLSGQTNAAIASLPRREYRKEERVRRTL